MSMSPQSIRAAEASRSVPSESRQGTSNLRGWRYIRVHVGHALREVRHIGRERLGAVLARFVRHEPQATTLPASEVTTVLICRINGRLGNTLFLTPLIRQIRELIPHASIDLALAYPKAGELLADLPGVRRIIVFPHKTPRMIWRFFTALRALRNCRYDLAIDPTPQSTSGRAAMTLCRARYRLGFATRSQWAPLTHAIVEPAHMGTLHQAFRPVYLLCAALGVPYRPQQVSLWLPLTDSERVKGQHIVRDVMGPEPDQSPVRVVGFFAHAAHFKQVDRGWWRAFWEAFLEIEPRAIPVEFLPSPQTSPMLEQYPHLHVSSLRNLAAAISATSLFISTDTGPMHLASSTSAPTVGLFQASDPTLYRPLKSNDLAIDITRCSPREAARRCHAAAAFVNLPKGAPARGLQAW